MHKHRHSHPPWVGTDYFCETGTTTAQEGVFYQQDPLGMAKGVGPQALVAGIQSAAMVLQAAVRSNQPEY